MKNKTLKHALIMIVIAIAVVGILVLAIMAASKVHREGTIIDSKPVYNQSCGGALNGTNCTWYLLTIRLTDGTQDQVYSSENPTCKQVSFSEWVNKSGPTYPSDLTCK